MNLLWPRRITSTLKQPLNQVRNFHGYNNRICKGLSTFNLPDIKWDGHHGVEDNDVTPEAEEASVRGALVAAVVQVPGFGAGLFVPEGMTDSQTRCHQDQQCKDLQGHIIEEDLLSSRGESSPF